MDLEIWSDIACSWCYVGKRRLESALAQFEHADQINIVWRSFELDPSAPRPAIDAPRKTAAETVAETRGVSLQQAQAMQQQMTDTAAEHGLEFHFERYRIANTFDAHRLLHLAREHGLQTELDERLLRAMFTDGELMSDHATLRRLAVECGLPADEVDELLASDRFADAVRDDERTAAGFGVRGVPFFVIDRAIAAPGALPTDQMLQFLRQGWESKPRVRTVVGGAACGIDGCD